jgi:hypothetical protein
MTITKLIEYIEPAKSQEEARELLDSLKLQAGFVGGRILDKTYFDPIRVQIFFEDCPELTDEQIEHQDGHYRRLVPDSMFHYLER